MDTDHNLLFAVVALQSELIDDQEFIETCTLWTTRKSSAMGDVLIERGVITPEDRTHVDYLVQRRLEKHGTDAHTCVLAASHTDVQIRHALDRVAECGDPDLRNTLTTLGDHRGHVLVSTLSYTPETRERYSLTRLQAKGGIGQVWLARDHDLGREVALKELRPERAGNPDIWARFLEEARVTGQLEHPGIIPVYELARTAEDQNPFYTMRFVKGRTLTEAIGDYHRRRREGQAGPLDFPTLLNAFVGVCNAVAYAHSRGVIHRDLKGQNVVLGDYGEVIVLDWGLAKLVGRPDLGPGSDTPPVEISAHSRREGTIEGQIMGTPAYMAPEQASGRLDQVDTRTDVYGLGSILYEILTGQPPFGGDDTIEVLRKVIHEDPIRPRQVDPSAPPALEAVCLRALAKRLEDRYASALALAHEVQQYLADEPVAAHREPLLNRAGRWARKHRPVVAGAAALLLTTVVALGIGTALISQEQRRTQRAFEAEVQALKEAQSQRQRAEANFRKARDAVDAMLSRVGEKRLRDIPQMERLRRELLEEALEFNKGFLQERGSSPEVGREAGAAYRRAGDIHAQLGLHDQAEHDYAQAILLFESLTSQGPGTQDNRAELAQACSQRGKLLASLERFLEAEKDFDRAQLLQHTLVDTAPESVNTRLRLGETLVDRGIALLRMGRHAESETVLHQAITELQSLIVRSDRDPEPSRQLARGQRTLANLLAEVGRHEEARQATRHALESIENLVGRFPENPDDRLLLSITLSALGVELKNAGRAPEAEAALRRAVSIQQKLANDFPETPRFRYVLATVHQNLGLTLSALKKAREAENEYREAAKTCEGLAQRWPKVPEYRDIWWFALHSLAISLQDGQRLDDAEAAYQRAMGIAERLIADFQDVPLYKENLGHNLGNLANLLDGQGKLDEAVNAYRRSLTTWAALTTKYPEVPDYHSYYGATLSNLADSLIKLKRRDEARTLVEQAINQNELALKTNPDNPAYQAALCDARFVALNLEADEGKWDQAAKGAEAVLRAYPALEHNSVNAAGILATCSEKVRSDKGLPEADRKTRAENYQARAVAILTKAQSDGVIRTPDPLASILVMPKLAPLKSRADFQALVRSAQTKTEAVAKPEPGER